MFEAIAKLFRMFGAYVEAADTVASSLNDLAQVGKVKSSVLLRAEQIKGDAEIKRLQASLEQQ